MLIRLAKYASALTLASLIFAHAAFAQGDGVVRVKSAYFDAGDNHPPEAGRRRQGHHGEAAKPFQTASGMIASITSSITAN